MMSRSEGHFRINDYIIFTNRNVRVKRRMDHASVTYYYRFEIIFLPFVIPVLAFDLCRRP